MRDLSMRMRAITLGVIVLFGFALIGIYVWKSVRVPNAPLLVEKIEYVILRDPARYLLVGRDDTSTWWQVKVETWTVQTDCIAHDVASNLKPWAKVYGETRTTNRRIELHLLESKPKENPFGIPECEKVFKK